MVAVAWEAMYDTLAGSSVEMEAKWSSDGTERMDQTYPISRIHKTSRIGRVLESSTFRWLSGRSLV